MPETKLEMTKKEIIQRFFNNDKTLYNRLKPSKEEIVKLENFEWRVYVDNGLKNINGGYASVKVYDGDEEELLLNVECGEQDTGGGGNKNWWRVRYDRKMQKFEEI